MHPTQQRKNAILASNLLLSSFLVQVILIACGRLVLHKPDVSNHITNPWVAVPLDILTLGWYYTIRQDKWWAKVLLLILVVIVLLGDLTIRRGAVIAQMHADGLYAAKLTISLVIHLLALGLLFWRPKSVPVGT